MLKIKIHSLPEINLPETELSGTSTVDLVNNLYAKIPAMPEFKTTAAKHRWLAYRLQIPLQGISCGREYKNTAWILYSLVTAGQAEWQEFNEEEFNPKTALGKLRAGHITHVPKTDEEKQNMSTRMKAYYANLTPEQKAAARVNRSNAQKERYAKMSPEELEKLVYKREQSIAAGKGHRSGPGRPKGAKNKPKTPVVSPENMPDWMK